MAKPTSTTGFLATGNRTVPPLGKLVEGFLSGEIPPEKFINELFAKIEEWLKHVDTGVVELANINQSIDGIKTFLDKIISTKAGNFFDIGSLGQIKFLSVNSTTTQELRIGLNCDPALFAASPFRLTQIDDPPFEPDSAPMIFRFLSNISGTFFRVYAPGQGLTPWTSGLSLGMRRVFEMDLGKDDVASRLTLDGEIVANLPDTSDAISTEHWKGAAGSVIDPETDATEPEVVSDGTQDAGGFFGVGLTNAIGLYQGARFRNLLIDTPKTITIGTVFGPYIIRVYGDLTLDELLQIQFDEVTGGDRSLNWKTDAGIGLNSAPANTGGGGGGGGGGVVANGGDGGAGDVAGGLGGVTTNPPNGITGTSLIRTVQSSAYNLGAVIAMQQNAGSAAKDGANGGVGGTSSGGVGTNAANHIYLIVSGDIIVNASGGIGSNGKAGQDGSSAGSGSGGGGGGGGGGHLHVICSGRITGVGVAGAFQAIGGDGGDGAPPDGGGGGGGGGGGLVTLVGRNVLSSFGDASGGIGGAGGIGGGLAGANGGAGAVRQFKMIPRLIS